MTSRTQLVRWGNSLAVRIPKPIAEQVRLKEGDELQLQADADGIRIHAVQHRPSLQEALKRIQPDSVPELLDWEPPQGSETW
jgi:antitoxin component of MazEF toxin-antitoxin module